MAQRLKASGDYRVLRRLGPRPTRAAAPGAVTRLGLFVDVETTGLDRARDEIIELAMAAVERAGLRELREGQQYGFDLEQDRRSGKVAATNLRAG